MAYADYFFYHEIYGGNVLTEDDAERYLEWASDEIDRITSYRLQKGGMPDNDFYQARIKKATCAIADCLSRIDLAVEAASPVVAEDGTVRGAVASISSGRESISFGGANASGSVFAKAASNEAEKDRLLMHEASRYLVDIPSSDGVNLLYRGARGRGYV